MEIFIYKYNIKRWVYSDVEASKVDEIKNIYKGIPKAIAEILVRKGLTSRLSVENFFNVPLSSLTNPLEMLNMEKATLRIINAIKSNEKICIYGDYDVDGITATSAMYIFLKQLNADVMYYIPNRLEEGYGLNFDAIMDIASKKATLLITVDCGISAIAEVALATTYGIDVIVTDHHFTNDDIPKDAYTIVNPMQSEDSYSFKSLAGVGIAFKLIIAIRNILFEQKLFQGCLPNVKSLLDIVTLGTIADVVPLVEENRVFVSHGLALMSNNNVRIGINELKQITGLGNIALKTSHVGFQLAPRINAVGRMGSSDKSLKLLITDSVAEAKGLATELDNENRFRQNVEKEILIEAFDMIESGNLHNIKNAIVLSSTGWHPGVIGIVASRVVDRYFRPTIILSDENGFSKGSARSIPSFHLYDGISELSDILLSFGGHKYAAGVKLLSSNLDELKERFNNVVTRTLKDEDYIQEVKIDAYLEPEEINMDVIKWLSKFEPFGAGNKEPNFCMKGVRLAKQPSYVGKEASHLKCTFEKKSQFFDCIGYNMKDFKELLAESGNFDIVFSLNVNSWRGVETIQLNLKDIHKAI